MKTKGQWLLVLGFTVMGTVANAADVTCVLNAINVNKSNFGGYQTVADWESASVSLQSGQKSVTKEFDLSQIVFTKGFEPKSAGYTYATLAALAPESKVTSANVKRIESLNPIIPKAIAIQINKENDGTYTVTFGSSREELAKGWSSGFTSFGGGLGRYANRVINHTQLPSGHEVLGMVSCIVTK